MLIPHGTKSIGKYCLSFLLLNNNTFFSFTMFVSDLVFISDIFGNK